jgi:hypothetical protein
MKKILLGLGLTIIGNCAIARVKTLIDQEQLINQHLVDKDIAKVLDNHSSALGKLLDSIDKTHRKKGGVWQFKWLPGYYIKYNIARLEKREILEQCIQENKLHLLHTPEKYLYHINGRSFEPTSRNYAVIIKEVEDDQEEYDKPMDKEQVEQIILAVEKSGHISTFKNNYLRLKNRRISFIDTDGTFDKERTIVGVARLLGSNLTNSYTPEALYYIIDHLGYRIAHATPFQKKEANKSIESFLEGQKSSVRDRVEKLLSDRIKHYTSSKKRSN